MSEYNKIDGQELDRYITGNYGEDQFKGMKEADFEILVVELYDAFVEKHKEVFADMYEKAKFQSPEVAPRFPPIWEELSSELKQCWIAVAKEAEKHNS